MKLIISILLMLFSVNVFSQCSETFDTDLVQFCEFLKNKQTLNECISSEINNQFTVSDSVIIQIETASLQIYEVSYITQDSLFISYFTQKNGENYKIVKFKKLPILEIYSQYKSVSLGIVVTRETYINRKDFDAESKRE